MTQHTHANGPWPGTWLVNCDVCGINISSDQIRKRWDGLLVCKKDWEEDHPQKYIRVPPDPIAVPIKRPESTNGTGDVFIPQCNLFGGQAVTGAAVAGCSVSGTWRLQSQGGSLLTPPAPAPAPGNDPNFASLIYLNNYQGTNGSTTFTDASPIARPIVRNGDAQISTGAQIFGTSSAAFDGTGDYLQLSTITGEPLRVEFTETWSMGMWFRPLDSTASNPSFQNTRLRVNSGSNDYIQQHLYYSPAIASRSIFGYTDNNTAFPGDVGITPMTAGNWYYLFMRNTPGSDLFEWWLAEAGASSLTLQNTSTKRGLRLDQFGCYGNLPPNNEFLGNIGPTRIYRGYADSPTMPTGLFPGAFA